MVRSLTLQDHDKAAADNQITPFPSRHPSLLELLLHLLFLFVGQQLVFWERAGAAALAWGKAERLLRHS
jgi:hypothetical protein